jgi:uncharacterized protein (TIGR04376 family)
MGIFDDFSRFLEERLDEYMRANPQLELLALEQNLREQEEETLQLMTNLKLEERQIQDKILELAREIQLWHARIEKAKAANRLDLAEPAQKHEGELLMQGNQLWGQMEMLKQRIQQTQELQQQIQQRRKEVQIKVSEAQASRAAGTGTTTSIPNEATTAPRSTEALEQDFRRWEAEQELEQLKRSMGR